MLSPAGILGFLSSVGRSILDSLFPFSLAICFAQFYIMADDYGKEVRVKANLARLILANGGRVTESLVRGSVAYALAAELR